MAMAKETTIRQLRCFVALAEAGSFSRGAERLRVTQPALSYNVSKLEEHLSTVLVERGSGGIILTPEGRSALKHAIEILDAFAALDGLSRRFETGQPSEIRLGASPTLGPYVLPEVVQELHTRFPAMRVYIREAAPSVLLEGLLSGAHDGIIAQLPLRSDRIEVERLFREPLRLTMSRGHPLASQGKISDADLAGVQVLSLSSAFTLHGQIAALCDEVGAILMSDYEGTSLDALRHMTAIDMGVTFLPELYLQYNNVAFGDDILVRRFRGERLTRSIGLAWRKSSAGNPIYTQIADIIRQVVLTRFAGKVVVEGARGDAGAD